MAVKICRQISSHTFRVGVSGPECAQTTGVRGKKKKKKEVEIGSHQTTEARAVFTWVTHDKTREAAGQGPAWAQ